MFGNKKVNWNEIVSSYAKEPRDVKTIPLHKEGVWFYVYAENDDVYVENAKNHSNSSKIKVRRKLDKQNSDIMLTLHRERKNGGTVSQKAGDVTQNQVYWYGIFADMGL